MPPAEPTATLVPRAARVARAWRETHDTWSLELEDPGAPPARPGQFDMLYAFGVGEVPISFSGDLTRVERPIHTIRAVGAVTRALCALGPGDALGVRGPFGAGWPLDAARGRDLVILAGGIGLAPLRPLLYAALAERAEFGRVVLLYGARTPADLLYPAELEAWRRGAEVEVHVTVDAATPEWPGEVGVVTSLIARAELDPTASVACVCGPEIMMTFCARHLLDLGVPPERVHVSLERNMKCALGWCGRCQLGSEFVCRDGPVFGYARATPLLATREL
ncbi:MAG: FAD/NAD(P)-binding protein [Planctomycetota bacterium]